MGEVLANLGAGLLAALAPLNLGMIVLGLVIGILAGALPGITMVNSIVLVLPFTYLMGIVPSRATSSSPREAASRTRASTRPPSGARTRVTSSGRTL